jgi:hypothetical protein
VWKSVFWELGVILCQQQRCPDILCLKDNLRSSKVQLFAITLYWSTSLYNLHRSSLLWPGIRKKMSLLKYIQLRPNLIYISSEFCT